jgi:glycosidase
MKEIDAFFARTGYPRAPKYYIIKWLTDYITEYGIDGYRGDTVKHTDEKFGQISRPNVITHLKLGRKTIQQKY